MSSDLTNMETELTLLTKELRNYPAVKPEKGDSEERLASKEAAHAETKKVKIDRHVQLLRTYEERVRTELAQAELSLKRTQEAEANAPSHRKAEYQKAIAGLTTEITALKGKNPLNYKL
jgi:hypothetical protein